MITRVISRSTKGELLANKQMVQEKIADSWIELEQFRLLVLRTAWRIDRYNDYRRVLADISAVKALMPKVLHDIAQRALMVHGSLGVSTEMPFTDMLVLSYHMALADGPTEVHKVTVAKQLLRGQAARDHTVGHQFAEQHRNEGNDVPVDQIVFYQFLYQFSTSVAVNMSAFRLPDFRYQVCHPAIEKRYVFITSRSRPGQYITFTPFMGPGDTEIQYFFIRFTAHDDRIHCFDKIGISVILGRSLYHGKPSEIAVCFCNKAVQTGGDIENQFALWHISECAN